MDADTRCEESTGNITCNILAPLGKEEMTTHIE